MDQLENRGLGVRPKLRNMAREYAIITDELKQLILNLFVQPYPNIDLFDLVGTTLEPEIEVMEDFASDVLNSTKELKKDLKLLLVYLNPNTYKHESE